jgi:hypothetical protein
VRSPGLRALPDCAGFAEGETPTAGQVAFRIAPRMNAAGASIAAAITLEEDQSSRRRGYAGWSAVLKDFRPAVYDSPLTHRAQSRVEISSASPGRCRS